MAEPARLAETAGQAEAPGLAGVAEPHRPDEPAGLPGLAGPAAADEPVQPNGVDLSLEAVWRFREPGVLGVGDAVRHIPAREGLAPDADGWFDLPPATYGIRYAEFVQMPTDCGGLCFPRSSLLRMGLTVPTAVWDAGYAGRGEGLLVVTNPHGVRLQRGARIVQLVVFRLTQPTEGYRGRYLNENR
jgi:dUTP pyrophosphatase